MTQDPTQNRPMTVRAAPSITIGPDTGDLRGTDDKVLQAGVEYLHRLGGGILRILPGEYTLRNALYLRPNLTIRGSGPDTVLKKAPSTTTRLLQDSDWYESRIRVENTEGFTPGAGIVLRCYYEGGAYPTMVLKDTITAIDGDTISLSHRLTQNMWPSRGATVSTLFALLTAEYVNDVTVENLVLDGNREHNEELNGNYVSGVFIQHCDRYMFRNVTVRNYNCDGFSFQIADDIHFEDCVSENNAMLGFHPGSGSQRPVFRRCVSRGNNQGIFFCWGVSDGLAQDCILSDNRDFGVCIGHRDTDNRLVRCTIAGNGKVGVLFREETDPFLAGHRTTIEDSTLRDNGFAENGVAVELRAAVYDTTIRRCRFEDSGEGRQKIGVRIGPHARRTVTMDNTFSGIETPIEGL